MKVVMQLLLVLMLMIAFGTIYTQGWEQGMLLLVVFGFSARGYRLAEDFLRDRDQEAYDRQMKGVQIFTMVCVLISFYWPDSVYYNVALLACLAFHCILSRYVKKAGWKLDDVKKGF